MDNLEGLYLKMPIPLQNVVCSLQGARIQRSRFGGDFSDILKEAESRTFWSAEQLRAYRDERLRFFVQHCVRTVPFYRRRFRECGMSAEDIRTLEDLRHLPILTKQEAQSRMSEFISEAVPHKEQIIGHTSGSTGGGLHFATTLRAMHEQWAIWWRYRRWHGLQQGTWCGYFGGRSVVSLSQSQPPFWRYNYPGKQILFSGYHMNSENITSYVAELRRRRPLWLHGYPSLLALLASHLLESGAELGYEPRWITTGAENLLPQQARLIQRAFGVNPRQHYGMAEAVANISECDRGSLHADEDFAAMEFIPDKEGLGYKVVGTNLSNTATPLLRYDVQDVVTPLEGECSCGRMGRVVESVDGRREDYIVLKNRACLGRMDHIFKDMINVREAQIYQKYPGEIFLRIVRGDHYTDRDEAALIKETRKRVGDGTDIIIKYVERLERSRTGKLRFVISDVLEGQLDRAGTLKN